MIQQYIQDNQLNLMRLAGDRVGGDRSDHRTIAVHNPFTSEKIGSVPKATREEVANLISKVQSYRPELTRYERSCILARAAGILRERRDQVADLITAESGLSINDALYEVGRVCDVLTFGSTESLTDDGQIYSCDVTQNGRARKVFTLRAPLLGVITAITPFNHPMNQVAHKAVPSVATNNRILVKPSEKTPFSAILFADILYEAGLPPEMLSIVTGDPTEISDELITNPKVDLITFTGGVQVGKYIASRAGYRRVVLELGGNDPIIVMEDADLDEASTLAVQGSYRNSGQRCTAVKRLLVHERVADEFVEQVRAKTLAWRYGDPMDPQNHMGTVIDSSAATLFEYRVNEAIRQGAKLLAGNVRVGALYAPTLIDHVTPEMLVVMQETFGPVSPVIRFKNIDEAIRIANGTAYGLSSSVCTQRLDYISRFVSELEVGTVNVREVPGYRLELTPFGGIKDSGLGYKEGVREAMRGVTNLKTYSIPWP